MDLAQEPTIRGRLDRGVSPLELRHEDGAFASQLGAQYFLDSFVADEPTPVVAPSPALAEQLAAAGWTLRWKGQPAASVELFHVEGEG